MGISGFTYSEFKDSPTECFAAESTAFTRVFQVPWATRFNFVKALLGYTSGSPGNLQRIPPDRHPLCNWLWAREVQIQGIGQPGQDITVGLDGTKTVINWTQARITATYRALDWTPDPSIRWNYLTETFDITGELISPSNGVFIWATTPKDQVPEPPGIIFPGIDYTMVHHQVPDASFNPNLPFTLVGSVNDKAITVGKLNALPIGCMLFLGAESHREYAPDGSSCWQVTYKFHLRNIDHNRALRPGNPPSWQFIVQKGTGTGSPPTGQPDGTPQYPYKALETLWNF
jgi:hypothetical protein